MIRAVIRPEKESEVIQALERSGFAALTKWDVLGRGRQRGIQVGATIYRELAKLCLMLVVGDDDVPRAIQTLVDAAKTGHPGDGRIFVTDVKASYTIRSGKADA